MLETREIIFVVIRSVLTQMRNDTKLVSISIKLVQEELVSKDNQGDAVVCDINKDIPVTQLGNFQVFVLELVLRVKGSLDFYASSWLTEELDIIDAINRVDIAVL